MSKSKFVVDKIAKLFEHGLISYKDLSDEIINILKSKKDEIVFKLDLSSTVSGKISSGKTLSSVEKSNVGR